MVLALFSAVLFALRDVVTKKFLQKYDVTPSQMLFEMHSLSFLLLLFFAFPLIDFSAFYGQWYLFLLKAFFLVCSTLLYFSLLKNFDVSTVSPLLNLSPLFLLFLSTLFLGEVISFVQFVGILVLLLATYILELHTTHHSKKKPTHFHVRTLFKKPSKFFIQVFLMLIFLSSTALVDKIILNSGASAITTLYFTSVLSLTIFSSYFIYKKNFFTSLHHLVKQPQTLVIALIGFFDMIVILTALSFPQALVSIVIPLRRCSTLLSSLLGGMLFHETHLIKKLFATSIMIVGIILIVS